MIKDDIGELKAFMELRCKLANEPFEVADKRFKTLNQLIYENEKIKRLESILQEAKIYMANSYHDGNKIRLHELQEITIRIMSESE